jgi:hypothetical protein
MDRGDSKMTTVTAPERTQFTTTEFGRIHGYPHWAVRRACDALDVEIPRAGRYRLIPPELVETLKAKLAERRAPRTKSIP